jgi:uncharacterized protein YndB with AHSA1/START domain
MQRAEAEETIPAPPAEVFAFLADPANLPSWQTGVLSAERTSAGPVGRGSTARIVRELLGQRIAADLSMTAYEPDRLLELESTVSGVHAVATLELAPAGAATRVRFAMSFAAGNVFLAPIEGVAARAAEQDLATSLDRLRGHFAAHMEGG